MTVTELRELLGYISITHPNANCYFSDNRGKSIVTAIRKVTQTVSVLLPAQTSLDNKVTEDLEDNDVFVILTGIGAHSLNTREYYGKDECEGDIEED